MKKTMYALSAALFLSVPTAFAGPFTTSMTADNFDASPDSVSTPNQTGGSPDVKDAVNLLLGSAFPDNQSIDSMQITTNDSTWKDLSSVDNEASYALIGLSAANDNTLRVYDVNDTSTKIDVFGGSFSGFGFTGDGSVANPFPFAASPFAGGTEFGWNLQTVGAETKEWDSNPNLNEDSLDHMLTYQLSGLKGKSVYVQFSNGPDKGAILEYTFNDPYLISWEDLTLSDDGAHSDQDYNDMMYIVDRVVPVPEPMTLMLMSGGLMGLFAVKRRRLS